MRSLPISALLGLSVIAALAAGCYPKAGVAPNALPDAAAESAKAKFPDATSASLEEGRQLFLGKCNGCHNYPDFAAVDEAAWPAIVGRMGDKVSFNDDQKKKVREFILTARTSAGGAAPATSAAPVAPADTAAPTAPPATGAPAAPPATAAPAAPPAQ